MRTRSPRGSGRRGAPTRCPSSTSTRTPCPSPSPAPPPAPRTGTGRGPGRGARARAGATRAAWAAGEWRTRETRIWRASGGEGTIDATLVCCVVDLSPLVRCPRLLGLRRRYESEMGYEDVGSGPGQHQQHQQQGPRPTQGPGPGPYAPTNSAAPGPFDGPGAGAGRAGNYVVDGGVRDRDSWGSFGVAPSRVSSPPRY